MATTSSSVLGRLRDFVRASAENRPGVYRMLAESGVVLYVGKSKRIRTRLLGYFRARSEEKAWRIIREAKRLEWEYVPSEFASLLRELELIKRLRPPFNVQRKRDGIYSFLKVGTGPAGRIGVVRRITDDEATYFGPLRGGKRIVEGVRELNDVLRLRDCRPSTPIRFSDQQDLFGFRLEPLCARSELDRCLAPCAARCSEIEYGARLARAMHFLRGEEDGPLREFEERMADAASRMEFEHAARLRDRMSRLEVLRDEFQHLRNSLESLTFVYPVPGVGGEHQLYAVRSGSIRSVQPAPRTPRQRKRLAEALREHYRQPESLADAVSRQRAEEILLVAHWFRTRPEERVRAVTPDALDRIPLGKQLDRLPLA